MEPVIGIAVVLCLMIIAHFAQVTAQQLRILNKKLDEYLQTARK